MSRIFERRHYNAIAASVSVLPREARETAARQLANMLLTDGPDQFNLKRFLKACGVGED